MSRSVALGLILLFALGACAGCRRAGQGTGTAKGAAGTQTIQLKGSDTMVNLGQAWAEAFMKENPDVSVSVTGGGSGTGIAALINGTTDVAECSRAMTPEEIQQAKAQGRNPNEIQVAWDGIAVIVNPGSPVPQLTIDQLADIFTGKVTNWKQVGGANAKIVILSREVNSGTHVYFKEHVLQKGDKTSKADYATAALLMPSSQAIHDEVAQNLQAIGYVGLGYVDNKVKALKVAARAGEPFVAPSPQTIVNKQYPISRPLFFYTNGDPIGAVKTFVDFVLGPEGQQVVSQLDFVPLKS